MYKQKIFLTARKTSSDANYSYNWVHEKYFLHTMDQLLWNKTKREHKVEMFYYSAHFAKTSLDVPLIYQ